MALAAIVAYVFTSNSVPAASAEPLDVQTRFGRYYTNIIVSEDGTAIESSEWSMTILREAALERSKRASIGFSTSAQKADVVAAYTLKADGRRIDVPKDNYQVEVNRGNGKDSPVYSDWTTLTVVFPDVSVGDSVVFSYRITQLEPMFPRHYSTTQSFYSQTAYDDVRVRIDWPTALWVQYEARKMSEVENSTNGDRRTVEWRYSHPAPTKTERRDFSVFDPEKEVGYAFSTFKSYADISAAYGARAIPRAAPTERIAALAASIVRDKSSKKDQARALYDWVATNITYAGNCIGIGAVVPRDLSFVLDNKMGDCKDHATLLQALLSARGIASTQALVNSGSMYRLPRIPVVSTVNHVINYLPELDLYADSTSTNTPFGMLPVDDQAKPVLLVEGFRDGAGTPVPPIGSNREVTKSLIRIGSDGSISGTVEVTQCGQSAVQTRTWARKVTKDAEEDLVKNIFRSQGLIGSGRIEKDDPTGLADGYHYKVSLNGEKYLHLPGSGAFYVYPPLGFGSSMEAMLKSSQQTEQEADVVCSSGYAEEDYTIELPKQMKVLSIPTNVRTRNDVLTYTASYKLKGNVLTVRRTLEDRTKGNVCSPRAIAEFKKIAEEAIDNLREQVLYKQVRHY
jgi:transglutaminase-like putative cysteine protease